MSVNLKRNDMITLWNLLNKMSKSVAGGRIFKIFVAKNLLVLKPEIQLIEENFKAPDAIKEYEEEKRKILVENADKDETGAVIFNKDNTFNITNTEKVKLVTELIKELDENEKYADALEELKQLNQEFEIYKKADLDLPLMLIIESAIPDEIDITDLTILMELNLVIGG